MQVGSVRFMMGAALTVLGLLGHAPLALADEGKQEGKETVKPDVLALIKESTAVYKAMKSYQHTAVFTISGKAPTGEERKQESRYLLALDRPNRFCYKDVPTKTAAAICDGKSFINYKGDLKQYMKLPAPADYKGINIVDDVEFRPLATYIIALMLQGDALADKDVKAALEKSTLGSVVTENGKKWQILNMPFGENAPPTRVYFDTATHRIGKAVMQIEEPSVQITETYEDVKIDKPIDASVFAYTPPDTAKRVEKFVKPQNPGDARLAPPNPLEGKPAVNFALKDREGREVMLAKLKGKVVVLGFWASWCKHSQHLLPTMQELHQKFAARDVVVLAVNSWDIPDACDKFLRENSQYTLPVLMDAAETDSDASIATKLYGVKGVPTTLIIDKEGIVQRVIVGEQAQDVYIDALKGVGVAIAAAR